jgi:hypothetical protein
MYIGLTFLAALLRATCSAPPGRISLPDIQTIMESIRDGNSCCIPNKIVCMLYIQEVVVD